MEIDWGVINHELEMNEIEFLQEHGVDTSLLFNDVEKHIEKNVDKVIKHIEDDMNMSFDDITDIVENHYGNMGNEHLDDIEESIYQVCVEIRDDEDMTKQQIVDELMEIYRKI